MKIVPPKKITKILSPYQGEGQIRLGLSLLGQNKDFVIVILVNLPDPA